jgi:hypothetical protein
MHFTHSLRLPCLLLALASEIAPQPVARATSAEERLEDIAFLRRELPERHPNLFFKTERVVFEDGLTKLAAEAAALDNLTFALRLQEIVAAMSDPHTEVGWQKFTDANEALPLRISWFSDGWHVLAAPAACVELPGHRLVSINGVAMPEVERRFSRLIPPVNVAIIKQRLPNFAGQREVLRYLGLADRGDVQLTYQDDSGAAQTCTLSRAPAGTTAPSAVFRPYRTPIYLSNTKAFFWFKPLADEKTLYVQYNRCIGRELDPNPETAKALPSIEEFFANVRRELQSGHYEKLIFDVRHNPGGGSMPGTQFARELARAPDWNQPGRIFVIVGRRTFSSAIINAMDFRNLTHAVLIGEPTSGAPNHYGQTSTFTLPHSGLTVHHSTKYFRYDDSDPDSIYPDVAAVASFADYASGVDPALEAVRAYRSAKE